MDYWMEYQTKAIDRRNAARQRQIRFLLHESLGHQCWQQRAAFQCGLLLLRFARRLIAYGKPTIGSRSPVSRSL